MPKITVNTDEFFSQLGKKLNHSELDQLLTTAKAEIAELSDETIKIELNDTNRPDLWSLSGLTRQLRAYLGKQTSYPFFDGVYAGKDSDAGNGSAAGARGDGDTGFVTGGNANGGSNSNEYSSMDGMAGSGTNDSTTGDSSTKSQHRKIIVDNKVRKIRPYIVGFEATGKTVSNDLLINLIEIQERLCEVFGRKRKSVAMGIYRSDEIAYPIKYRAAPAQTTTFIPLDFDSELSLREILVQHPKGQEYGHIINMHADYPLVVDSNESVLSMPPIINSMQLGAVSVGDDALFVELTGDNMQLVMTAGNIVACDFYDLGFNILPVAIEYGYSTPFGNAFSFPFNFQQEVSVSKHHIKQWLGEDIADNQIVSSLQKMGVASTVADTSVSAILPPWRNDYMHGVDIIEDIMIGYGLSKFKPQKLRAYTAGRLSTTELFTRRVNAIMVGMGFQEMMHHYLVSLEEWVQYMYPADQHATIMRNIVQVENPRSENYNCIRNSIIPSLLRVIRSSANAVLPQKIFEVGKIGMVDTQQAYRSQTQNALGLLCASNADNFNTCNSWLSAIMYYLGVEYSVSESSDVRFILGRQALIEVANKPIGIIGEVSPQVLENWNIQTPVVGCELILDSIINA